MKDLITKDHQNVEIERSCRYIAEKRLSERPANLEPRDYNSLINELEVHQIELEMQNEELRRSRLEMEESREKYFELYDFAPVGYLTLNEQAEISELNLAAAKFLGMERSLLLNKPFSLFIQPEFQDIFYLHRQTVLQSSTKQTCEIEFKTKSDTFCGQLESISALFNGQQVMRSILMDITERKHAERKLNESKEELEANSSRLQETNTALKVLMQQREEDKKELETRVLNNVTELIQPYIDRLKQCNLGDSPAAYLEILETNLDNIISPFLKEMNSIYTRLTPTETQVADLIKQGKSSKEIARLFHVSTRTIDAHRENIRNKLGLDNTKTNLQNFLRSIH